MCGQIKHHNQYLKPGGLLHVKLSNYITQMSFGNNQGYYNARFENLYTVWNKLQYNRGIIEVESFNERTKEFTADKPLLLGGLYTKDNHFMILTIPAIYPVSLYHYRMPLIVNDQEHTFFHRDKIGYLMFNSLPLKLIA